MKSVIYEFDPVIYPFPLLVTKDYDAKELSELFYVVNTKNELEDAPEEFVGNPQTRARSIEVVRKDTYLRYFLILLVRPSVIKTCGTMAHEAYHATNQLAHLLGFLPEDPQEDEPCAYLLDWMANCIESVKKGHPEKMKGVKV